MQFRGARVRGHVQCSGWTTSGDWPIRTGHMLRGKAGVNTVWWTAHNSTLLQ